MWAMSRANSRFLQQDLVYDGVRLCEALRRFVLLCIFGRMLRRSLFSEGSSSAGCDEVFSPSAPFLRRKHV